MTRAAARSSNDGAWLHTALAQVMVHPGTGEQSAGSCSTTTEYLKKFPLGSSQLNVLAGVWQGPVVSWSALAQSVCGVTYLWYQDGMLRLLLQPPVCWYVAELRAAERARLSSPSLIDSRGATWEKQPCNWVHGDVK